MRFDPDRYHRRSLRLKGYDYSQPGAYFVTICTRGRECTLGDVMDGRMVLSPIGETVQRWWLQICDRFERVELDEFVIMPNHIHGIIVIRPEDNVGAIHELPQRHTRESSPPNADTPRHRRKMLRPRLVVTYR